MRVGIDLGTTFSLIAAANADGTPALFPDLQCEQSVHTPSAVYVRDGSAVVGHLADCLQEHQPELPVLRFWKRQFGSNAPLTFSSDCRGWTVEGVAALMLRKLKADAEVATGHRVIDAVIGVPAHFSDRQRRSVLHSAQLSGLAVADLIDEPIAAAIHYGVQHRREDRSLLVYDFGGGTFDATVLSLNARGIYVLAKTGLTDLGGKEVDEAVGSIVLQCFERTLRHPLDLSSRTLFQLRRLAESLKIDLCSGDRAGVSRMAVLGSEAVRVAISNAEFEDATRPVLDRAEQSALQCIAEAGLTPSDIDDVLLVGGSSMIPLVRDRLGRLFPASHQRLLFHEPTRCVALGAALRGAQLSGDTRRLPAEFRTVSGHYVGVRTVNAQTGATGVDVLIKKNMPLPARAGKTFFTSRPNQGQISLELVQFMEKGGEQSNVGKLVIGPLPAAGQRYAVEVQVEHHENGTLLVRARDPESGRELTHVFGDEEANYAALNQQRDLLDRVVINNG